MMKTLFKIFIFFNIWLSTACAQNNAQQITSYDSAKQSTVLIFNPKEILPLKNLNDLKIASVNIDNHFINNFEQTANNYANVKSIEHSFYSNINHFNSFEIALKNYNTVLFSIGKDVHLSENIIHTISQVSKIKNVVVIVYEHDKNLILLENIACALIYSKNNNAQSASFVAQLIFGGEDTKEVLQNNISSKMRKNVGLSTNKIRLSYGFPEQEGMKSSILNDIDDIMINAIDNRATPGAVILVAKNGRIVYQKSFGKPTYQHYKNVDVNDIYDLASISKIFTTTIAMQLHEAGLLHLDSTLGYYLPETINTNKEFITVRELLLHEAGLIPYIPFFERLKIGDYSRDSSAYFPTKVADDYFISKDYYKNVMYPEMINSPLRTKGVHVYSDLSMYFLKEIIEKITRKSLDEYSKNILFQPLALRTTTYTPRKYFDRERIIPTENDVSFRKTLLQGYVHDQGAAMAGGVSGHAGLFSNANDLAILFQLFLNKGTYGAKQILNSSTVTLFTTRQSERSRRGLGFDRWDPNPKKNYPSRFASDQTFGHTGYTGTSAWADPKHQLIYIFLSNRVHPQVTNKLTEMGIRTKVLDVIYRSFQ